MPPAVRMLSVSVAVRTHVSDRLRGYRRPTFVFGGIGVSRFGAGWLVHSLAISCDLGSWHLADIVPSFWEYQTDVDVEGTSKEKVDKIDVWVVFVAIPDPCLGILKENIQSESESAKRWTALHRYTSHHYFLLSSPSAFQRCTTIPHSRATIPDADTATRDCT